VPVVAVKMRLVTRGQFSGLVSSGGWLYAVEPAQHGPQLAKTTVVRIDPTSGRIVARSAILPGAVALTFAGNTLWLMVLLVLARVWPLTAHETYSETRGPNQQKRGWPFCRATRALPMRMSRFRVDTID